MSFWISFLFSHLFSSTIILSSWYVPGTVPDAGNIAMHRQDSGLMEKHTLSEVNR